MEGYQRKEYLWGVLSRQPTDTILMKTIRNSKDALNAKFGTHVTDMSRIRHCLYQLEKEGKIRRNWKTQRIVTKKFPQGIDNKFVYSITVLNKSVDTNTKKQ